MKRRYKEILPPVFAGLLFLLFAVTRLYRLSSLPEGLHCDEAGAAYDALCLARYGVDRYLKSWPVYLINFGGGQNALYTWICAVLFKIYGGFQLWLCRLVSVFFNLLTVVFTMKLAGRLYKDSVFPALAAGTVTVICPCFILMSRFGLESYLMAGMSAVFLYLFLRAVESEKIGWYIGAGISGGLVLYTYALSYFILPAFLALALIYLLRVKRFRPEGWIAMAIPMGLLAFPLILVQLVNLFDWQEMRLGIFTITKLPIYRSSDLQGISLPRLWNALKSIFEGDWLNYNSIPGIFNMYVLTIPLSAVGFVNMLVLLWKNTRRRLYDGRFLPVCWFVCCLLLFSMMETNVNRVNGIFSVVVLMAVDGLWVILKSCAGKWKIPAALCVGALYLGGFLRFAGYYYGGAYEVENKPLDYFDIMIDEGVAFLSEHPEFQGKGTWMAEAKIYYALSAEASPYDLTFDPEEDGLEETGTGFYFSSLGAIEDGYNYIVRDIYPEYAQELRNMGYDEQNYGCYSLFYKNWEMEYNEE